MDYNRRKLRTIKSSVELPVDKYNDAFLSMQFETRQSRSIIKIYLSHERNLKEIKGNEIFYVKLSHR